MNPEDACLAAPEAQGAEAPPQDPPGRSGAARETVKPFRLVQNFTSFSLVLIFAATLVLSMILTQRSRTVLMEKNEEYAVLLANNLNHQVFQQFILPTVQRYHRVQLSNEDQFNNLDNVVRHTLHGFNVDTVNIYNKDSQVIYSFDPDLVGEKPPVGREYYQALEGESVSKLLQTGSSWGIWLGRPEKSTLKTFTTFYAEKPQSEKIDHVLGVFEVGLDLSADYRTIFNFLLMVVLVSASVMLVLFLILRFYVGRGEAFLLQRAEERLRLEEQLSHAERLASLGEMAAGVSHEIRNPLGIIRSTAELLGKRTEEANRPLLNVIIEESTRLNDIITDFLSFARPLTPKLQPCNLGDVLNKNLAFLAPRLEKDGHRMESDLPQTLPTVQADPNLLYQCFLNILINAMQAMPEGGTVFISAQAGPGHVTASFTDEGPGVDEAALKKIWNPFFTTKEKGTGLGLCVVRNIIEAHGGAIRMENSPDKGACVSIELPLEKDHGNHTDR